MGYIEELWDLVGLSGKCEYILEGALHNFFPLSPWRIPGQGADFGAQCGKDLPMEGVADWI